MNTDVYDPRRRHATTRDGGMQTRPWNGWPRRPAGLDLSVGSVRETREEPVFGHLGRATWNGARSVVPARGSVVHLRIGGGAARSAQLWVAVAHKLRFI